MTDLVGNIRYAARTLSNSLGTTTVIVATLGVAIGAVTVIFSVIDLVWHIIPIEKRDRLVFIASTDSRRGQSQAGGADGVARTGASIPDLADWTAQSTTLDELAGFTFSTANLTGANLPIRVSTVRVTSNLPGVWGIEPLIGRGFRREDGKLGAEGVVLITHRFWQRQFSGNAGILGRTFLLNGQPYTIAGVMPPQAGTGIFGTADVFVPVVMDPVRSRRDERTLFVTGLLKPGVTREQAASDLTAIARRLQSDNPGTNSNIGVVVRPLLELVGANTPMLLLLLAFMGFLLIAIAASNVSNVVLAQLENRRHEFVIRAALGARRLDQVKQVVFEGLLCSAMAALLGVFLAFLGLGGIRLAAGSETLGFNEIRLNERVLLATTLITLAAPFAFALIPGLRSSRVDAEELKAGSRRIGGTIRGRRLREGFVAVQVALALVLVIQIGLVVRTAWKFHELELGFDSANLLTFRIDLDPTKYSEPRPVQQFFDELAVRLQGLPDVVSVGATNRLPIADRERNVRFSVQDATSAQGLQRSMAGTAVNEKYLSTMRIPVKRGRVFMAADFSGGPRVALVNQEAARRYWPKGDAIGQLIAFESFGTPDQWYEIVGLVGNIRNSKADEGPTPQVYVPDTWVPEPARALVLRTAKMDPLQLVPAIRAQVAEIDRGLPIYEAASMGQVLFNDLAGTYMLAGILAAIGFVALCVAAAGIYGVVRYAVSRRTHEIGIRMALGANPNSVVRMIVSDGCIPVLIGIVVGWIGAAALVAFTSTAITEIEPKDLATHIGSLAGLSLIALWATYFPARRATRVDPVIALRHD